MRSAPHAVDEDALAARDVCEAGQREERHGRVRHDGGGTIRGNWRTPFFEGVAELLAKTKDVRLVPVLTKVLADRNAAIGVVGLTNYKAFVAVAAQLENTKPKPLDKAAQKLLAGTRRTKPTSTGRHRARRRSGIDGRYAG